EAGPRNRITADTDAGRLTETGIRGLLDGFVGQGTGARNDPYPPRLVDVPRLDTDLALARRDHAGAVRTDQAHAQLVALDLHFQHVEGRNALGDAHDELDAAHCRFDDRV